MPVTAEMVYECFTSWLTGVIVTVAEDGALPPPPDRLGNRDVQPPGTRDATPPTISNTTRRSSAAISHQRLLFGRGYPTPLIGGAGSRPWRCDDAWDTGGDG